MPKKHITDDFKEAAPDQGEAVMPQGEVTADTENAATERLYDAEYYAAGAAAFIAIALSLEKQIDVEQRHALATFFRANPAAPDVAGLIDLKLRRMPWFQDGVWSEADACRVLAVFRQALRVLDEAAASAVPPAAPIDPGVPRAADLAFQPEPPAFAPSGFEAG